MKSYSVICFQSNIFNYLKVFLADFSWCYSGTLTAMTNGLAACQRVFHQLWSSDITQLSCKNLWCPHRATVTGHTKHIHPKGSQLSILGSEYRQMAHSTKLAALCRGVNDCMDSL